MLGNLNEAQRQAVEHGKGPLLILAGAGTGKTRTIACRIAYLIKRALVEPRKIMAVTFTRKAALEMATRVRALLTDPALAREVSIGTFHALSSFLLRESAGASGGPELLPETGQRDLVKEILKAEGLGGPGWQPLDVLRKISLAKGRLLSPEDLASDSDPLLAKVYSAYQLGLEERRLADFDDLIGSLVRRWQEAPEELARHQSLFRVMLVDEFQDVNEAQYRWLQFLTAPHSNLCVVGDTDQSIYAFRGSNVRIFQSFQEDFPQVKIVKLEQNYRSSQTILGAASAVIAHNANPFTCKLQSESENGPPLRLARLSDEGQEAQFVVTEIERLLGGSSHYQIYRGSDTDTPEDAQYGFADIGILYRTHAQSRALKDALARAGIPTQVVGENPPFVTPAADALLSYLCFAANASSDTDLRNIVNVPPRGLGEKAQSWLEQEIGNGTDPWEVLELASRKSDFPVRVQAAWDRLRRSIVSLQGLMVRLSLKEVLERAWEEIGLHRHFQESGGSTSEGFRWLHMLAALYADKPAAETLPAFMGDLSQWRAGDFYDPRADAVTLMTLHAAKGLEFPAVFICGVDEQLLPLVTKHHEKEELEEERRLFYVAMTRARHLLILSTVRRRLVYGEYRTLQPSPFLSEIPAHCIEKVSLPADQKKKPAKEKQLSLF